MHLVGDKGRLAGLDVNIRLDRQTEGHLTLDTECPRCRVDSLSISSGQLTSVRPLVRRLHSLHGEVQTGPVPSLLHT